MSSDESVSIRFAGVTKRFSRHHGSAYSLRALLFERRDAAGTFEALHDVTFEVRGGTTMGLIGGNGAGKSTLLRVAAGLSPTTEGEVTVPADTQSVLGLGAGFDGTLTGRENALTALVVNGLGRREAAARLAAVVEFAEIEPFFDSPVRTYSAGMALRLAFGVAAQFDAEAFLVDEVLSVGDVAFEQKCIDHLTGLKARGATIMMASHDLTRVAQLCDEAVWMHGGRVRKTGPAGEVVEAYREAMRSKTFELTPAASEAEPDGLELRRNRFGTQQLRLSDVRLNGSHDARIPPGGALRVTASVHADEAAPGAIAGVVVRRESDGLELVNENVDIGPVGAGRGLALEIGRLDLTPGGYLVDIGLYRTDWQFAYDFHWGVHRLEIVGDAARARLLAPPVRWSVSDPAVDEARAR